MARPADDFEGGEIIVVYAGPGARDFETDAGSRREVPDRGLGEPNALGLIAALPNRVMQMLTPRDLKIFGAWSSSFDSR